MTASLRSCLTAVAVLFLGPVVHWGLLLLAVAVAREPSPPADPLPSWSDTAAKRAIIAFVHRVNDESSPDHVPPSERIAVFDNDCTLWPENPLPFQAAFIVDQLTERAATEPEIQDDPMVQALLAGDLATLMAGDRHDGLLHVVGLTHAGLTVDEFRQAVDDKAGKPSGIHQFIGRRPIACFGNSDGDLAMLQYTTVGNPRPSLGVIVHHTDADREYAYDAEPKSTGRLVDALAEAARRNWTIVDMRRDWSRVFATATAEDR